MLTSLELILREEQSLPSAKSFRVIAHKDRIRVPTRKLVVPLKLNASNTPVRK